MLKMNNSGEIYMQQHLQSSKDRCSRLTPGPVLQATRTSQNVACQYHHYTRCQEQRRGCLHTFIQPATFTPSSHLPKLCLGVPAPADVSSAGSTCACGRKQRSPQHGAAGRRQAVWGRTHEDVPGVGMSPHRTCEKIQKKSRNFHKKAC